MILDNKGYLFITKHEGLSLKPYLCPAKIPTIGYGNCYYPDGKRVTLLDKDITKQQAFDMFKEIANRFGKRVDELVITELTQNQFNALVSFAYNIGTGNFASSTLLKKINKNANDLTLKAEFLRWNKAGGKVLNGLTNRRNEEADLYFS